MQAVDPQQYAQIGFSVILIGRSAVALSLWKRPIRELIRKPASDMYKIDNETATADV